MNRQAPTLTWFELHCPACRGREAISLYGDEKRIQCGHCKKWLDVACLKQLRPEVGSLQKTSSEKAERLNRRALVDSLRSAADRIERTLYP